MIPWCLEESNVIFNDRKHSVSTAFQVAADMTSSETPGPGSAAFETAKRERWMAVLEGQNEVLELIAKGAHLDKILEHLALAAERAFKGARCSIALLNADGMHLQHAAAPNLPDEYRSRSRILPATRFGSISRNALVH
jgi:hypothetical protein